MTNKKDIFENNSPSYLLRLGLACNLDCCFCNIPPESGSLLHPLRSSQNDIKKKIDDIFKHNLSPRISISGGEPTLYPKDLINVIKIIKKRGAEMTEIQTNAIAFADSNLATRLKSAGLDSAFVSFHTHNSKIFDILVGKKGSYGKCIAGIKNLNATGIKITLNPVINSITYKNLPDYIKFVNRYFPEIKSISLSVVQPRGRAANHKILVPRYGLMSPYVKKFLYLADKFKIKVNNPYCGLPFCIGSWHERLRDCMEFMENFMEIRKNKKLDILASHKHLMGKIKPATCERCDLFVYCNGVWREYSDIHPLSDLKPLKIKKISGIKNDR